MGITVQPLKTIFRDREQALRKTLAEIQKIVEDNDVEKIILGLPLNMDDSEGDRALATRAFAEKLALRVSVPIEFADERLTTIEAAEILEPAASEPLRLLGEEEETTISAIPTREMTAGMYHKERELPCKPMKMKATETRHMVLSPISGLPSSH
jgi:putative transcription antitermination factor YqgF